MYPDRSLRIDPDAQVDVPLRDLAYQTVQQAIQSGRFSAGEHLSEHRLSQEMGISRTPIREALRKLEADRWVERRRSGLVVAGLSVKDIAELFGVRIALESFAAGLAAKRATLDDVAELRHANRQFRIVCREHRASEIVRLNIAFHRRLNSLADNRLLLEMTEGLSERMRLLTAVVVGDPDLVERTPIEHEGIIDAIERGDSELASERVRSHLCRVRQMYAEQSSRLPRVPGFRPLPAGTASRGGTTEPR